MPYGPIELLVVEFPGNQFSGELAPALTELVNGGTIRIIDILFVTKDADGNVSETELSHLTDGLYEAFDPIVDDVSGMLTHDDAVALTAMLAPGSSVGIMLFENVWAKRFADAVVNANGHVIVNERIPQAAIEEMVAEHNESVA